jgi:hypothetical protein
MGTQKKRNISSVLIQSVTRRKQQHTKWETRIGLGGGQG